jgi:hypothetical protein
MVQWSGGCALDVQRHRSLNLNPSNPRKRRKPADAVANFGSLNASASIIKGANELFKFAAGRTLVAGFQPVEFLFVNVRRAPACPPRARVRGGQVAPRYNVSAFQAGRRAFRCMRSLKLLEMPHPFELHARAMPLAMPLAW